MPASSITVFNAATGAIRGCTSIPAGTEDEQCLPGEAWISGWFFDHEWRIDPVTLEPLPLLDFAVTIDANRISGIPPGTKVVIEASGFHPDDIPEDGTIEISVAYPQTLSGVMTNPLYHPLWFEVPCAPEA